MLNLGSFPFLLYKYEEGNVSVEKSGLKSPRMKMAISPNPFNRNTMIQIEGELTRENSGEILEIRIFDIKGKMIERLSSNSAFSPPSLSWEGSRFPSGIYLLKAKFGNQTFSKRLFLQK